MSSPHPPDLLTTLYQRLRAAAQHQMRRERPDHTLTATALVHEAYLRVAQNREIPIEERAHFYATAVEAMRRVLLDHAKARGCAKRGGGRKRVDFDAPIDLGKDGDDTDYEAIDAALQRLEQHDPRMAQVVRLRFYAGLSIGEIAQILQLSSRTVKSDWAFARAWLGRELAGAAE